MIGWWCACKFAGWISKIVGLRDEFNCSDCGGIHDLYAVCAEIVACLHGSNSANSDYIDLNSTQSNSAHLNSASSNSKHSSSTTIHSDSVNSVGKLCSFC